MTGHLIGKNDNIEFKDETKRTKKEKHSNRRNPFKVTHGLSVGWLLQGC